MNHDEVMARGQEMLHLNDLITKYTETYVRPSLSDIMAFDIIKDMINESIEDTDLDFRDYVAVSVLKNTYGVGKNGKIKCLAGLFPELINLCLEILIIVLPRVLVLVL